MSLIYGRAGGVGATLTRMLEHISAKPVIIFMGKIDLCAFDMSNDSMYFVLKNIEPSQNSNVLRPLVDGHRAYLAGQKNLHCIDLENRQILWQKGFPGQGHHLMLSNLIIEGDLLVVKADDDHIYGFNKFSGQLLWATAHAGASPSHMKLAGNRVYYISEADAHIYGVNITDGSVQVRIRSPNEDRAEYPGAGFHGGLAINEQLGLIYAHDHHFFMGIKIP
jgi:outer membrane protein assembly factor BamB